ncbi:MAG: DUF362 domain-containing protein [Verrucomicrobiota bacterium]
MIRVACIQAQELRGSLADSLDALGADVRAGLRGARILVKPSLNSPDPPPASTDPEFLSALVQLLKDAGAADIVIGDSCGLRWCPADKVHERLGVPGLARRLGATYVNFDSGPWRTVPVNGRALKEVAIAEASFQADKIVYAACMKTHRLARYSLSLKHAAGFLSPKMRCRLHQGDLESNIADINLAVKPDLIFVDGRTCFVSGGPARGWVRRPGMILASTDRVAVDVEALKILLSFFAFNRVRRDPWANPQIRHAVALNLGATSEADYEVVRGGASR